MVQPYGRDIPALTTLRMFAATAVVFFHLSHFTHSTALMAFPLVSSGYLGVDFFFVLSGFVLTHVYQPQIDAGRFDYWQFAAKRLGQIYPLHLAMLAVSIAMLVAMNKGLIPAADSPFVLSHAGVERPALIRALIAHLTLIHAWGSTPSLLFNLPSWSISAEWFAYLAFPVFVLLRRLPPRREGAKLAVSVLFFLTLALAAQGLLHAELTKMSWNIGILRIVPEFTLGMALHRFGENWTAGRSGSVAGFVGSLAVIVVSSTLAAAVPSGAAILAAVTVLGLAGMVLFAADANRYGRLAWLGGASGVYLGEISYSIYMLHMPVAEVVCSMVFPHWRPAGLLMALGTVMAVLLLVIACSALSYKLLEVPARVWIIAKARKLNSTEKRDA